MGLLPGGEYIDLTIKIRLELKKDPSGGPPYLCEPSPDESLGDMLRVDNNSGTIKAVSLGGCSPR
jgi:hypothetical protein